MKRNRKTWPVLKGKELLETNFETTQILKLPDKYFIVVII